MSSPLYKHTNDNSAMKQRKAKSTNTAKSTTNLDSRTELADLVKRKAEIAVGRNDFHIQQHQICILRFRIYYFFSL